MLLFREGIAAGFALVSNVLRSQGDTWVTKNLPGKVLAMGDVGFDPWRLELVFADLVITARKAPDRPLLAANRLEVYASIASV